MKVVTPTRVVVDVPCDEVALPEEIDVEAARQQKASAEAALKAASGEAFEEQRAHLEAAVTRISVAARR